MRNRITDAMLEIMIKDLNALTGAPNEPYKPRKRGAPRLEANKGTFMLSSAYGGVSLHRMGDTGGVSDVFRCGHVPKRELYGMVCAYRDALEAVRNGSLKVKRARV